MVFVGEDAKEEPEEARVINSEHNPCHLQHVPLTWRPLVPALRPDHSSVPVPVSVPMRRTFARARSIDPRDFFWIWRICGCDSLREAFGLCGVGWGGIFLVVSEQRARNETNRNWERRREGGCDFSRTRGRENERDKSLCGDVAGEGEGETALKFWAPHFPTNLLHFFNQMESLFPLPPLQFF